MDFNDSNSLQILVKSQTIDEFCDFVRCLKRFRNIGKVSFTKISWLQNDGKMA